MFWSMRFAAVLFTLLSSAFAKPLVLTSNYPLELFTKELVQDQANVHSIVPPNVSPHLFELKPSDQIKIRDATLLIYVDPSLDNWVVNQASGLKSSIALLSSVKDPLRIETSVEIIEHDHDHDHHHHHGSLDPHIWMGPKTMLSVIPSLVTALCPLVDCEKLKARSEIFQKNLEARLQVWDSELSPVKSQVLMTAHPFLNYFARDFGFKMASSMEPIAGRETPAKRIVALQKLISKNGIRVIFYEPTFAERAVRVLENETGIRSKKLDPLGAEGIQTYFDLIDSNISAIRGAFSE